MEQMINSGKLTLPMGNITALGYLFRTITVQKIPSTHLSLCIYRSRHRTENILS